MVCKYNSPGCNGCESCEVQCESTGGTLGDVSTINNVTFSIANVPNSVQFYYVDIVRDSGSFGGGNIVFHQWKRVTIETGIYPFDGVEYGGADQINGTYSYDLLPGRTTIYGTPGVCSWVGGGDFPLPAIPPFSRLPKELTQFWYKVGVKFAIGPGAYGPITCPNPSIPFTTSSSNFVNPYWLVFDPYLTEPFGGNFGLPVSTTYMHWVNMWLISPRFHSTGVPLWNFTDPATLRYIAPIAPVQSGGGYVYDSCDETDLEWYSPPPYIGNIYPPDSDPITECSGFASPGTYGTGSYAATT